MIRTQVQLTEDQARALRRAATQRGVSVAALIRELVDEGLGAPAAARSARARAAVGRYGSGSNTVSRDHDRELDSAFSE